VDLIASAPDHFEKAHDPTSFIYTDGSVVTEDKQTDGPGIGAAVCILEEEEKDMSLQAKVTIPIHCKLPGNQQNANTINRAELAAIAVALQHTCSNVNSSPTDATINIATDSLSCIRQIQRTIQRPHDMEVHRHFSLLAYIANMIDQSTRPVHLWKVKSHSGILGNELADKAAVAVATGTCTQPITTFGQASNDRFNNYWPCQAQTLIVNDTEQHQIQQGQDHGQRGTRTVYVPVSDIDHQVKAAAMNHCQEGSANQDSLYVKAWKTASLRLSHKYSHLFLRSKRVPTCTRKLCLQARWGLLPHNKNLYRWKKVTTSACPICGEEDGSQHAISACRGLNKTAIIRHNNAGSLITLAIRKGGRGAEIITSDVGLNSRLQQQEQDKYQIVSKRTFTHAELQNNISMQADLSQHIMQQLVHTLSNKLSVPDILMYRIEVDKHPNEPGIQAILHTFTIVEIKYCRDTRPEDQWTRATEQHSALAQALTDLNNAGQPADKIMVEQANILLGATGGIFTDTIETLKGLGVAGKALQDLLTDLHYTAIDGLDKMWKHRQAVVRHLPGIQRANWSAGKRKRYQTKSNIRHWRGKASTRSRPQHQASGTNKRRMSNHKEPDHRKQKRSKAHFA
jgi:ribonuclease HI